MSKLFFVALACLVALVAADSSNTTQIQSGTYSDSACTVPLAYQVNNYTAGDCIYNVLQAYPSADNAFVYLFQFASGTTGCPAVNVSSAVKISAGVCGATAGTGTTFTMYKIYTLTVNPTAPTFPPTGFSTTTQYINTTDATPDNTCSSTRTVVSAYPTPATVSSCYKTHDNQNSVQSFLDSTCTTQVSAQYSDNACTNLVQATYKTVEFKSCNGGYAVTCTGTGLPDTSALALGYKQFDNNQCSENSKTVKTSIASGACYGGGSVSCATTNGTNYLTAVQYANNNCTGAVVNTRYVTPDVCLISGDYINITATCSGGGGGGNSAAAASVSAIVMIVAAFVALVAGRSL